MTHLDLFAGILGFSLAARWVWGKEYELVACCEIDPFCQRVIRKHFPEVPIIEDIKKARWVVTESTGEDDGGTKGKPSGRQTEESGDGYEQTIILPLIDLLTAGFPCQPFSCAGRRAGTGDDRYLWPETIRIIRETKPSWVVLENVAGLLSILEPSSLSEVEVKEIELFQQDEILEVSKVVERIHRRIISRVIDDLKQTGYLLPTLSDGTPIVLCLPACGVGAPHRRDRVWIVAHTGKNGLEKQRHPRISGRETNSIRDTGQDVAGGRGNHIGSRLCQGKSGQEWRGRFGNRSRKNDFDTKRQSHGHGIRGGRKILRGIQTQRDLQGWWDVEPDVGRVAYGVPSRVDRLKSLGNAIVPQVAETIFRAIREVEEHEED